MADHLRAASGGKTQIAPEEVAAFDPASDEGRRHMRAGGRKILDHPDLQRWRMRGEERVTLDPLTQRRLGVGESVSLSELLTAVRRQPASPLARQPPAS